MAEETSQAVADATASVLDKLLLTPALRVDGPSTREAAPARKGPVRRSPSELEQRIAELERAVDGRAGAWEPDGSETVDRETPKRFVFQHDEAAAVRRETPPAPRPAPRVKSRMLSDIRSEDGQLREMVAAMVREELQGDLGERITRNIRKLVRSEIHRAFLMRDIR